MALSSTSSYGVTTTVLTADVPNAGTLTVAYPTGTAQADYTSGNAGNTADNMAMIGSDKYDGAAVGFAYGASNITVTNSSGVTWSAASTPTSNTVARFGFPRLDPVQRYNGPKAVL